MSATEDATGRSNDYRERLEQVRRTIEEQLEPDREQCEHILRQRAASLAQESIQQDRQESTEGIHALTFTIAGGSYAFDIAHVTQVYPLSPMTSIPGLPGHVVGIVAIEGEVLSVLDLRSLFNLPISHIGDPTAIIVIAGNDMQFGVLAEELTGINWIPNDAVDSGVTTLSGNQKLYLQGVSADRTGILDAAKLLADQTLIVDIN